LIAEDVEMASQSSSVPTTPRKFFEQYVRRSFDDLRMHPDDEYLAMTAAEYANAMAGRLWHHHRVLRPWRLYGASNEGEYRNALAAKECAEYGLIRDVADGFKHLKVMSRGGRAPTVDQAGARPTARTNDSGTGPAWTDETGAALECRSAILIELDDGSTRPLLEVMTAVVNMWDQLSSS
jgi:hypothetical protein